MRADGIEQTLEVRQSIGLHSRHIQLPSGHRYMQLYSVARQTVGWHCSPRLPVVGDCDRFQLSGDGTWLTVINVIEVAKLEGERRTWAGVQHEMNVPGGAIRRRALVIVDEIESDHVVDNLVPQRRPVLDAGVDVLEGRGHILRRNGSDRTEWLARHCDTDRQH